MTTVQHVSHMVLLKQKPYNYVVKIVAAKHHLNELDQQK